MGSKQAQLHGSATGHSVGSAVATDFGGRGIIIHVRGDRCGLAATGAGRDQRWTREGCRRSGQSWSHARRVRVQGKAACHVHLSRVHSGVSPWSPCRFGRSFECTHVIVNGTQFGSRILCGSSLVGTNGPAPAWASRFDDAVLCHGMLRQSARKSAKRLVCRDFGATRIRLFGGILMRIYAMTDSTRNRPLE